MLSWPTQCLRRKLALYSSTVGWRLEFDVLSRSTGSSLPHHAWGLIFFRRTALPVPAPGRCGVFADPGHSSYLGVGGEGVKGCTHCMSGEIASVMAKGVFGRPLFEIIVIWKHDLYTCVQTTKNHCLNSWLCQTIPWLHIISNNVL